MKFLFPQKITCAKIKHIAKVFNKNNKYQKRLKRIEKIISKANGTAEELIMLRKNNSTQNSLYMHPIFPFNGKIFFTNI